MEVLAAVDDGNQYIGNREVRKAIKLATIKASIDAWKISTRQKTFWIQREIGRYEAAKVKHRLQAYHNRSSLMAG